MSSAVPKPPFCPEWIQDAAEPGWTTVLRLPAEVTLEAFFTVAERLTYHPELNSTVILRADIVSDTTSFSDEEIGTWREERLVRRRLLPRTPRDPSLLQDCRFFRSADGHAGRLALQPLLKSGDALPFYHPPVHALAFSYAASTLALSILPHPGTFPLDPSSRLCRTLLALLRTLYVHAHSVSSPVAYVKRVHHDRLVPRSAFQDLYLVLKEKYKWVVKDWKEATDAGKHVFEDIAIASWLVCLWKEVYASNRGRPPGGFVDVGCGNGLLVFILNSEGFDGFGFDLRSRKSWSLFSPLGARLHVATFSPHSLLSPSSAPALAPDLGIPEGSFLIGNHADELTPWVPVMTAIIPESKSANVPCCFHKLGNDRFSPTTFPPPSRDDVTSAFGVGEGADTEGAEELVRKSGIESVIGKTALGGRYQAYVRYIASLTLSCGFVPEFEALRIPSTKNLCIVARTRCSDTSASLPAAARAEATRYATELVERFGRAWIARTPESDKSH